MKYNYECKVEIMEEEVATLSDTLREEITRLDAKFKQVDEIIEMMGLEHKDNIYNLKAE